MATLLASSGVVCKNYPEDVLLPGEIREGMAKGKGISDLTLHEQALISKALDDDSHPLKFVCAKDKKGGHPVNISSFEDRTYIVELALVSSKAPVIIGAPPSFDSKDQHGRRKFADGTVDRRGLPRSKRAPVVTQKGGGVDPSNVTLVSDTSSPPDSPVKTHARQGGKAPKVKTLTIASVLPAHPDDSDDDDYVEGDDSDAEVGQTVKGKARAESPGTGSGGDSGNEGEAPVKSVQGRSKNREGTSPVLISSDSNSSDRRNPDTVLDEEVAVKNRVAEKKYLRKVAFDDSDDDGKAVGKKRKAVNPGVIQSKKARSRKVVADSDSDDDKSLQATLDNKSSARKGTMGSSRIKRSGGVTVEVSQGLFDVIRFISLSDGSIVDHVHPHPRPRPQLRLLSAEQRVVAQELFPADSHVLESGNAEEAHLPPDPPQLPAAPKPIYADPPRLASMAPEVEGSDAHLAETVSTRAPQAPDAAALSLTQPGIRAEALRSPHAAEIVPLPLYSRQSGYPTENHMRHPVYDYQHGYYHHGPGYWATGNQHGNYEQRPPHDGEHWHPQMPPPSHGYTIPPPAPPPQGYARPLPGYPGQPQGYPGQQQGFSVPPPQQDPYPSIHNTGSLSGPAHRPDDGSHGGG